MSGSFDLITVCLEAREQGQSTFLAISDKIARLEESILDEVSTVFVIGMAKNMKLTSHNHTIELSIGCLHEQVEWFRPYLRNLLKEKWDEVEAV